MCLQVTPAQVQGVREVSVQVARAPVGSTEIAALKASNESPSEFRGSVRGREMRKKNKERWRL